MGEVDSSLPVHFFTIVLNGQPHVRHHIEQFKKLPFRWHWHIVEGVAELKHDTSWSLVTGGRVPNMHDRGRSTDGTSAYIDSLAAEYPDNVTVYRKAPGVLWDGKLEMVNTPLNNVKEEALLWEVDADELWTAEQIAAGREMFKAHPKKTAARYWCWFFVGPDVITVTRQCYANGPTEWLRTWRFRPGMLFAKHEPPLLTEQLPDGRWRDVAEADAFTQNETEREGLVFQHYAYTTVAQLQFKEEYYGYHGAVRYWFELQRSAMPAKLGRFFPWVKDQTMVNRLPPSFKRLLEIPAPVEPLIDPAAVPEMRVVAKTPEGAHLVSFGRRSGHAT